MLRESSPSSRSLLSLTKMSSKAKVQPKQVKASTGATRGATRGRTRGRGRAAGRPTRKTQEELDAEMTDYFVAGTNGTAADGAAVTNGAPAAAAGGDDLGMDEISVRVVQPPCMEARLTLQQ